MCSSACDSSVRELAAIQRRWERPCPPCLEGMVSCQLLDLRRPDWRAVPARPMAASPWKQFVTGEPPLQGSGMGGGGWPWGEKALDWGECSGRGSGLEGGECPGRGSALDGEEAWMGKSPGRGGSALDGGAPWMGMSPGRGALRSPTRDIDILSLDPVSGRLTSCSEAVRVSRAVAIRRRRFRLLKASPAASAEVSGPFSGIRSGRLHSFPKRASGISPFSGTKNHKYPN
jgi:hypothetical protein